MQKLFVTLFDILFPPSADTLRVRTLSKMHVRALFQFHHTEDILVLSHFSNPDIRALIHETKFQNNTHATKLLGALCDLYFEKHLHEYDIIIPAPLSSRRMRERGYNQVYEVLRTLPHIRPYICTDVLKRSLHTTPQTELNRAERLSNIKNAFAVQNPSAIFGKHILIVDDVVTTGATIREAKASLLPHSPASVTCLSFAH